MSEQPRILVVDDQREILELTASVLSAAGYPSATCTTGGLPSEFSYLNLGKNKNKGFELGIDGAVNAALNIFKEAAYCRAYGGRE